MQSVAFRLEIVSPSPREGNILTGELEQWLRGRLDGATLSRQKEDSATQDAGTILIAALSAPAVCELAKGAGLELAKGIADWLRKRRAVVNIGADGTVTAENVRAEDVEQIILNIIKARQQ